MLLWFAFPLWIQVDQVIPQTLSLQRGLPETGQLCHLIDYPQSMTPPYFKSNKRLSRLGGGKQREIVYNSAFKPLVPYFCSSLKNLPCPSFSYFSVQSVRSNFRALEVSMYINDATRHSVWHILWVKCVNTQCKFGIVWKCQPTPHLVSHQITESHQALVMCSDLSQRDGTGLTVLVCQLAIIIIRFEGVSGSCSVQAPLCLTVAKICSLRDLNGEGYGVTQCLLPPLNICMSLAAMSLMTCSSWPCLSALASTRGARGPWSWGTCLFWEVIWSRTLCLPNPACLLILLSTVFNREPFTRVTPSKAVIRTLTPD